MLRLKAESKLHKVTSKVRSTASIYNSWSKASPPAKNGGRYAHNEPEYRHNIEVESGGRSVAILRQHPFTASTEAKRSARSKDNLKSLEIRPEPQKNTSPNYNDLKMKRMIRQQYRQQHLHSKNLSAQPDVGMNDKKPTAPSCPAKERHTVSVDRMDQSIGEMVEQGALNEHVIKDYITQLQHVLVAIKQKQHSQRSGLSLVHSTVKKKVLQTDRKDNCTNDSMNGSVRRILFRPVNVRRTIEYEDKQNIHSPAGELHGASECSLKDTQQLRQQSSRHPTHTNLLSLVINRTKQQRKMLNLIEVRERYKQEKSQNSNSKASVIEQTPNRLGNYETIQSVRGEYSSRNFAHPRKLETHEETLFRQPSKTIETSSTQHNYKPIIHPIASRHQPQTNTPIQEEDSKVHISNFSSPLQLPKRETKPDLLKLNLDLSAINNRNPQGESIDSANNPFESRIDLPPRCQVPPNRILDQTSLQGSRLHKPPEVARPKKKLIDIDRWKKNFPVGFFDQEAS